jgi:signal transduction histidine kinase
VTADPNSGDRAGLRRGASRLAGITNRHPLATGALLGSVFGALALAARADSEVGERPVDVVSLAVILAVVLGVVLARERPMPALGFGAAGLVVGVLVGEPDLGLFVPVAYILYQITASGYREAARGAVVALIALQVLAGSTTVGWGDAVADGLLNLVIGLVAIVTGEFTATRRARLRSVEDRAEWLEEQRVHEARVAVEEERARLARELHDVVAHAVTAMVLQADGALGRVAAEPERVEQALGHIQTLGRQAGDELRHMLLLLRGSEGDDGRAPVPGMASLPDLVEANRDLRISIRQSDDDRQPVGAAVGLAIYRIVQEAITNARRHGGASAVDVRLLRTAATLEVEVTDDGSGLTRATGSGHGLIGMRERASICGGTLEAGPLPGGGWQVRARFPQLAATSSAPSRPPTGQQAAG